MVFQFMSRIAVPEKEIAFVKRAMREQGPADPAPDRVLGYNTLWNGNTVEVRLCYRVSQTALLAVALFSSDGQLKTYRNSEEYCTGFTFMHGIEEYVVCIVPEG